MLYKIEYTISNYTIVIKAGKVIWYDSMSKQYQKLDILVGILTVIK
jgi:hypothetical protein